MTKEEEDIVIAEAKKNGLIGSVEIPAPPCRDQDWYKKL